ncbi:MAG: YihY/virulence factor BrkB family protein [Acidimicrobiia bacterium]
MSEPHQDEDGPALPERAVRRFDRWQTQQRTVGFLVAVVRKYADDRGSAFAALVTHYAFLALFPLLVLLLTVVNNVMVGDEQLRQRVVDTVAEQLPVIGDRLQQEAEPLQLQSIVVVLSIGGLLWGATGMYNSAQLVMSQIWNVEGVQRPGFFGRLWRAGLLFATLGAGALVSTVAWWAGAFAPTTVAVRAPSVVGVVLLNALFLFLGLRIVTPPVVPWRSLAVPALLTGVAWEALRYGGQWLVSRRLAQLDDLYGAFGLALVTIAWVNLVARAAVLAVEASVVGQNGLWPRRLAQPPFTDADREALDRIVRNEHRRPEQRIEVSWQDPEDVSDDESSFRSTSGA